jgi:hypothetical protein
MGVGGGGGVIYLAWRFLSVLIAPAMVGVWAFWIVWDCRGRPYGFCRFVAVTLRAVLDSARR